MSNKKLTNAQLKKFRGDVAKLKSKGLVGKKVDARSQKPTRYMLSQVKKYDDVLQGKATVAHTPTRAEAKAFSERYRIKGKSVVIPTKEGERVAYSKKTQSFSATRRVGGKKVTRELYPEMSKSRAPSKSKNVLYVIPIGNTRQSFDTWEDLVLFMEPYEQNPKNSYKEWEKYVEIVRVEDADDE